MVTGVPSKRGILPLDYDVFVGLDVDKQKLVAHFVSFGGLDQAVTLPYDAQNLLRHVGNHYGKGQVAFVYEAGPTGFGLYDALTAAGKKCLVVSPAMVPTAAGNRVKTNRRDARQLAVQLRGGGLEGIHVPVGAYRELRQLTSLRNMQGREGSAHKCRVKALLLQNGIAYPEHTRGCAWTKATIAKVRELECTPAVRYKLDRLLDRVEGAHQEVIQTRAEIRRHCRGDADLKDSVEYLRSIPGVGWNIAAHFLARVGDWRDLGSGEETVGFVGLSPSESSTADRVNRGGITGKGDRQLRRMLIQGAWVAVRKDPQMRAFFERVRENHPRQIASQVAIVAVARKLVLRMYAMLTKRKMYEVREA